MSVSKVLANTTPGMVAFVASATSAGLADLTQQDWHTAFLGATDAMVSYPLLIAADGSSRAKGDRRWLANRSFVGQDEAGRIGLGTTPDAFFSRPVRCISQAGAVGPAAGP